MRHDWLLPVLFVVFVALLIWLAPKLRQRPPTVTEVVAEFLPRATTQLKELSRVFSEQLTPAFQNFADVMQEFADALRQDDR